MLNFIIASVNNLNIEEINICDPENTTLKAFQVIGYILFILKILVPIIIIILGIIEFGKAALSGDEKANTTSFKTLMMKIVAGIMIFFIPTVFFTEYIFIKRTSVGTYVTVWIQCGKERTGVVYLRPFKPGT
mgnify:CR=1 FL=1